MSLDHAILGFLSYGPRTGYDLKKVFDSSVRHFWPAQQSQIYRTLTRLAESGFVDVEVQPQGARPSRKIYSLTPSGRCELHTWIVADHPEHPSRAPFLIQIFFAGMASDEEALALLRAKAEEVRQALAYYEAAAAEPPDEAARIPIRDQFFWYLTLDYGMQSLQFTLEWLEDTIARIERKAYRKGRAAALPEKESP
jgi:DNA-binding PadR family transcriptional regulator